MSDFRGFSEIEINGGDSSNNSEKQGKEINTKLRLGAQSGTL